MREKFQKLYTLLDSEAADDIIVDLPDANQLPGADLAGFLKNKLFLPDNNRPHFITGHKGCGKTIELLNLKNKLEKENTIVFYVPLDQHISINDIHYVDVLLALVKCISEELVRKDVYINYTSLGSVNLSDLKDMIPIKTLSFDLKFSTIVDYIKYSEFLRDRVRELFDKQAYNLVNSLNDVFKQVSKAIEITEYKDFVVLFDGLDNCLPPEGKKKDRLDHLFENNISFFNDVNSKMLVVLPVDRYFKFNNQHQITFISDLNSDETADILKSLLDARIKACEDLQSEKLFDNGVVDAIVEYSAGNYGQFISIAKECCIFENNEIIAMETLDKALNYLRLQLFRKISVKKLEKLKSLINSDKKINVSNYNHLLANNLVFYRPDKPGQLLINPLLLFNSN